MNQEISKILIDNINRLMRENGWNAVNLGKKSGLSSRAIRYILSNERMAKIDSVEKIANALGVMTSELLEPKESKPEIKNKSLTNFYKRFESLSSLNRKRVEKEVDKLLRN